MTQFSLTGSIAQVNHARICAGLRKSNQTWLLRYGVWIAIAVFWGLFKVLSAMHASQDAELPGWISLIWLILFFSTLAGLAYWQKRQVWTGINSSPIRQGTFAFELTSEGLQISHDHGGSFLRWSAFVRVVDDAQGLVLQTGPLEYILIPDAAFADPNQRSAVLTRIQNWINA